MGSSNFYHQMSLELRFLAFNPYATLTNFTAFLQKLIVIVGFEVLVTFFLDVTPCSVIVVYRRFGALCMLLDPCWFLTYLTLDLKKCSIIFLRNFAQYILLLHFRCKTFSTNSSFGVSGCSTSLIGGHQSIFARCRSARFDSIHFSCCFALTH
jgi:hypothetical protein